MLGADRLLWTKDGKGGADDPITSMSILLKWLASEGNYTKYRGGPTSHGKGKLYWASILSAQIKQAGIRKFRSPKAIKNKIGTLEESFKSAHDWAGQTGAGVREDDPQSFNDYVLKKCPYYFDLLEVMEDRSTARPKMTSDTLGSYSDSDDSSDNDSVDDDDGFSTVVDAQPHGITPQLNATSNATNAQPNSATNGAVNGAHVSVTNVADAAAKKAKTKQSTQTKRNDPVSSVVVMQQNVVAESNRHNVMMEQLRAQEMQRSRQEFEYGAKRAREEYEQESKMKQRAAERAEEEFALNAKIARLKAEEMELKAQEMQLSHSLALVDAYHRVKGKLTKSMIKKKFPALADFVSSDEES
jgi:hypothetical protein